MINTIPWRITDAVRLIDEQLINSTELATVETPKDVSVEMALEMARELGNGLDENQQAALMVLISLRAMRLKEEGRV